LSTTTYVLPERMRAMLSRPFGDLVPGANVDLSTILQSVLANEKPSKLILVGDHVSRQATSAGIMPDVMIIDNLEKRQRAETYAFPHNRVVTARNQAGKIEHEARLAVGRAVRGEADLVVIEGEEDLLAIIAIIDAPLGSLVVYGQPNEGVVLVRVTEANKLKAEGIIQQMEREN